MYYLPIHNQYKIKDDVADSLMSNFEGHKSMKGRVLSLRESKEETPKASERWRPWGLVGWRPCLTL